LKDKLPKWAPVFISMLVKRACETEGEVKDCPEVVAASNKYRQSQDSISGFISDKLIATHNPNGVTKKSLGSVFNDWNHMNSNKKPPKLSELEEAVIKKFGKKDLKKNKWFTFKIREEDVDNVDNEDNMEELEN